MYERPLTFLLSFFHQVVDTPYLINPEWKNFIPGYMYNDSDLELTSESLYRQGKLRYIILYTNILQSSVVIPNLFKIYFQINIFRFLAGIQM